MSDSLTENASIAPPKQLAEMFSAPPLVANERAEDYERFALAICEAIRPTDIVCWILVADFITVCWEVRRERKIKNNIIKSAQIAAICEALKSIKTDLLTHTWDLKKIDLEARQWSTNPKLRKEINKVLADNGFEPDAILAQAFIDGAKNIDAIDRRLTSYERRRTSLLGEIEERNESLARRLELASSSAIENRADVVE